MAFPSSGLFVATFLDALDTTQTAINLDLDTHKFALYTNSITADLTADTAYDASPWNANEVTGTGYTAGGFTMTTSTFTHTASGVLKYDSDDPSWSTSTITARGGMAYADALASNNNLFAINFGADYTSTAGTFLVTVPAGGWWTWDLIP
jgi:hypothetical protein